MAGEQKRRKTYRPRRRRSGSAPPFQITPRDLDILRVVFRYRFLNSFQIIKLINGSEKNIRNRLKGLFELELLDRPACQYDFYKPGGGSSPLVYALSIKGERLLLHQDGMLAGGRVSARKSNQPIGRPFLEHTLDVADFAVNLITDVQQQDNLDLIDSDALIKRLPLETQSLRKPFKRTVPVLYKSMRHQIGVDPDYAFSLADLKRKRRAHFFVEIDRGTMPVERYDLKQTSILRKYLAYNALWKAKMHNSHFGWKNFRVLFVTCDKIRAQHMRDCLYTHMGLKGSPLFWFTDKLSLEADNTLAHKWSDGQGMKKSLLP